MNDYSQTPLTELFTQMAYLEQEIGLKTIAVNKAIDEINQQTETYEEMRTEVVTRFPIPPVEETFKPKQLIKKI